MKGPQSPNTKKTYSADRVILNLGMALVRDFRTNLGNPTFCSSLYGSIARADIGKIRDSIPTLSDDMDIANYKATYQMQSLFKRYRFEKDLYTDQELKDNAITSFMATQDRIRAIDLAHVSAFTKHVLACARVYITNLLGVYCDEQHRDLCRFGRRASVGIPARKACEAARWEQPVTGSLKQISWFDSEMSQIASVQEYWARQRVSDPNGSPYREVTSLKLSLVPKSFKSLRAIMPNTTIGSYMSFGLGEIMRKKLKRKGHDISKLQMEHRDMAARGSVHQQYVTMDLSSASDSISVALVERLFPEDWYSILSDSRIGKVLLPDGRSIESLTFCTMGIGYTFPLQTIVFLSLLEAIHYLRFGKQRMTISVYGDDMIFHRLLYPDVVAVFKEIGFVVNVDKTFYEGHFRESCGGDYFRGVDVRPFQPRNGQAHMGSKTYEAMLYKYINGLLMRWSEYEVRESLDYLLSELNRVTGKAKIVPVSYPDDSGIRCSRLGGYEFLRGRTDVAQPKAIGHGLYRFSYLKVEPELREEKRHDPYLWLSLRSNLVRQPNYVADNVVRDPVTHCQSRVNELTGITENVSPLLWKEHPYLTTRSKLTGRRLRRMLSYVTIGHTGKYVRQSGVSCFEIPQI